ncbi:MULTISPECIES: porin [Pontibacter]|uniref:Phosphate-selective porin O and P n=1 Tax=Pontibacter lucknowensis TaxID=1077936 RepID=A0A1N6U2S9_9BACT|nr:MULTISPECIES: porin [Pontibacter]EJF11730.1 phosphate-selective porin O and P [Pontibacter sp. BAB1700]SIQ59626.1 Phosphate-selective porin O and P [Pontibacter lucknowensis]
MNHYTTRVLLALFTICLSTFSTQAQTINKSTFGKGLQFIAADSSFSLQLGARFQLQYQGGYDPNTKNWEDRFLVRRSRLKFDGFAFSPRLVYKIELGLSNSDIGSDVPDVTNNADNIILDAVAKWALTPNLRLWVGQTKLPGNRERVISSQKLQFVDRSLLNSRFNLDRDAGLQLHHEHQLGQVVLREIGSISMGEGRDITVNNSGGYDYTGRVEILPFGEFKGNGDYVSSDIEREQTPKLSLAASYDYNNNAAREQAQLGDFLSETRTLRTWFVDAMFKYRGFSAMGEYANRKAPGGPVVLRDEFGDVAETFVTGTALNLQAGYLMPSNWEVAGRYTDYNPTAETGLRNQEQYTLGVSRYIVGHSLKVQSDVTFTQEAEREDQTQFRLQMELAF